MCVCVRACARARKIVAECVQKVLHIWSQTGLNSILPLICIQTLSHDPPGLTRTARAEADIELLGVHFAVLGTSPELGIARTLTPQV